MLQYLVHRNLTANVMIAWNLWDHLSRDGDDKLHTHRRAKPGMSVQKPKPWVFREELYHSPFRSQDIGCGLHR